MAGMQSSDDLRSKIAFKGAKDFRSYKFAIGAKLIKAGCLETTLGETSRPEKPEDDAPEQERVNYRKALKNFTKQSIDGYHILVESFQQNPEYDSVCEKAKIGDGPALWAAIVDHVQSSDPATQARLIDEYEKVKQEPTESVASYMSRLYAASQQLSNPPSTEQLKLRAGKMVLKKYQMTVFPETMKADSWPTFLEACRQSCCMYDTIFSEETVKAPHPGLIAAIGAGNCEVCNSNRHKTLKCELIRKARELAAKARVEELNEGKKRHRDHDEEDDDSTKRGFGWRGTIPYHMTDKSRGNYYSKK
jgi:hypothetical protein